MDKIFEENGKQYLDSPVIWRDDVLTSMNVLREIVDTLETKVDGAMWPIPTYADLLFGIK